MQRIGTVAAAAPAVAAAAGKFGRLLAAAVARRALAFSRLLVEEGAPRSAKAQASKHQQAGQEAHR